MFKVRWRPLGTQGLSYLCKDQSLLAQHLLKSVEGKNTSTYLTATSQKLPGKANIRLSHLSNERHEHSCHYGEVSALEDKPWGADSENISHKPAPDIPRRIN